jgi:DNA polymerase III subunit delta'
MGFDSFLGNAKTVRAVRDMLAQKRIPGSMLFTGPDGVGKKTLAMMLGKALNCEQPGPRGDDFCGECDHCRKADDFLAAGAADMAQRREIKDAQRRVEALVYFDLQLIEPLTRYILIEQIRQLRATAYNRPFNLPRRVFIVDQANTIHWQAADLLLKVLEEPPATTTMILICPHAFELRPTIRSRCITFQFSPVEDALIERILAEERGFPKPQLALAMRVINGSVARARTFDLAEYVRRRKPWVDFLEVVARPPRRPLGPGDWKLLFDTTKSLTADSGSIEETFQIGSILFRDLLQELFEEPGLRVTNIDLTPRLKAWARAMGIKTIEKLAEGIEQIHRQQTRNINQQLSLDSLAASLLRPAAGA